MRHIHNSVTLWNKLRSVLLWRQSFFTLWLIRTTKEEASLLTYSCSTLINPTCCIKKTSGLVAFVSSEVTVLLWERKRNGTKVHPFTVYLWSVAKWRLSEKVMKKSRIRAVCCHVWLGFLRAGLQCCHMLHISVCGCVCVCMQPRLWPPFSLMLCLQIEVFVSSLDVFTSSKCLKHIRTASLMDLI